MSSGPIDFLRKRALFNAARHGDLKAVRRLLLKGVFPNTRNRHAQTPLHLAARNGHTSVAKALIDAGADPNPRESHMHFTPLHWAVHYAHADLAEMLLSAGARIGDDGEKLLERARRNNDMATVLLLRQQGVRSWDEDVTTPDPRPLTTRRTRPSPASGSGDWWDPHSPTNKTHTPYHHAAAPAPRAAPAPQPPLHHQAAQPRRRALDFIHPLDADAPTGRASNTGPTFNPRQHPQQPVPSQPPRHHLVTDHQPDEQVVHTTDPDLMLIASAWDDLPLPVRQGMTALVRAALQELEKSRRHNLVG